MTSIILRARRPNCQLKSVTQLVFYVSADLPISQNVELNTRFSHRSILPQEVCTKEFHVLGGQYSFKELK